MTETTETVTTETKPEVKTATKTPLKLRSSGVTPKEAVEYMDEFMKRRADHPLNTSREETRRARQRAKMEAKKLTR